MVVIAVIFGGFFERLDWSALLWSGLWTALAAFTLGLSFLLWTRWGEYHLTVKCVIFSVLAHMILGLFFAAAEVVEDVVVALNPVQELPPIQIDQVRIVNVPDDESRSGIDGRQNESAAPAVWDRVTGRPEVESASMARPEPDAPADMPLEREAGADAPLPDRTPQPEVPIAGADPRNPDITRAKADELERAPLNDAPAETVPNAAADKSEIVPNSPATRNAPAIAESAPDRPRARQPDVSGGMAETNRTLPRSATPTVDIPDPGPKPIASPLRASSAAAGKDSPAVRPIASPEIVPQAKGNRETASTGDTEPSTSVRIGVRPGSATDRGETMPGRTKDSEGVKLPAVRAPGLAAPVGEPTESTLSASVRPVAPGATPAGPGIDRQGIRLGTPEIYKERMSPNRSEQAVKRGGSKASEEAVGRALEWLALHQEADGRWDADGFQAHCPAGHACAGTASQNRDDCAVTGLVLLAFLGAGNTHWDGKYSSHVLKGLNWLIQQEKANGDLRGTGRMYSQGIATLALSEALAMSSDPKLRDPVQRAAQFIIQAQNTTSGGWRYLPGQYGDTSVFGWQLMALKSASLGGIEVPDMTWQRARTWLALVGSGQHRGLASYQPTEAPTPPMTAEALVCRVFLGEATESATLREAADYLMQYKPQWNRLNLYYWYYGTLACFQMGGEYWTQWNASVRDVLISHQVKEGHAAGSWDPNVTVDPWGREGGRVYSTALAALCLEVYYRFLPVHSVTRDDGKETPGRVETREQGARPQINRNR